jgi:hypothetical protein
MESDSAYARRRAQEERKAARKAGHPNVRRVHRELASRYEVLLLFMERQDERESLRNSDADHPRDREYLWL